MRTYEVLMTAPAADDVRVIAAYVANELREPSAAAKLVGEIKEAVMSLSTMPARHPLVADKNLALQGIRKMIVGEYIVFYVVSEKQARVTVLRILYAKRDWVNLL